VNVKWYLKREGNAQLAMTSQQADQLKLFALVSAGMA
jgi:hypothetical protein